MSSSAAQRVIVVAGPSPDLRLTVWPLRDEPLATWIILGLAALASVLAGVISGSWLIGGAAAVALAVALWRMWLPVEIRLYELGVTQTILRRTWRMPWRTVAAYRVCTSGVLLLSDDDDSPLGRIGGLYIPWGKRRNELLAVMEHYLPT